MTIPDEKPLVNDGFSVFAPIKFPKGPLVWVQLYDVAFVVIPDKLIVEFGHSGERIFGIPITAAGVVPGWIIVTSKGKETDEHPVKGSVTFTV